MSNRLLKLRRLPGAGVLPAALVVLPPLLWLVAAVGAAVIGGTTPGNGSHGVFDAISLRLLARSTGIAALVTLVAAAVGTPFGWLVARYRLRVPVVLLAGSLLPLLLPPYAGALSWVILLSRTGVLNRFLAAHHRHLLAAHGSEWLVVLVLASAYWPIAAWFTVFAAQSVPRELDDSARLHLPDSAAARWAALPALARALPAGWLLIFLLSLADFAVPSTLGVLTYPVDIVNRFQLDRDPGQAARMALPLLCLVVPLVFLQVRRLDGLLVAPVAGLHPHPLRAPFTALTGWIGGAFLLFVTALLPLGTLVVTSMPLREFSVAWTSSSEHFYNTLLSSGSGAVLAASLALAYGWSSRRRRIFLLDAALTLPYALPASLVAVAMIALLNRGGPPGWLYGTMGALVWTYAILFFPFAQKTLQPAWGHVSPELLDEAEMMGASSWQQFRTAAWPVVRTAAVFGGGIVALLSAREIDATALIRVPGGDTLGFRINDYMHFASVHQVAAVCVMLEGFSLALFGGLLALIRWWEV